MLLLPSFCDDPSIFIILICHVAEAPEVNMDVASSSESMSKTTQAQSKHQPRGIKGIVHPKMKILSSFTHPQVDPNLYECVCSEHKGRYSEECGKQSSSGAPLTSIVFFFLLCKSMVPQNSLITNFLQNIFLCVQNKHIHTGLDLLEDE